jgi:hypothetical protein
MRDPRALKLAVIGDPVAHSASPDLHRGFLAEANIEGTYEAIRVALGTGAATIDALRARGYTGLNVTTPLKEEAFARADERDPAALAAGSVNTLILGKRIAGYNTDGLGAIGALHERGLVDIIGKRILVLGAGPTARSCVASFTARGARATIWNRTAAKAAEIAHVLGARAWSSDDPVPDAVLSARCRAIPPCKPHSWQRRSSSTPITAVAQPSPPPSAETSPTASRCSAQAHANRSSSSRACRRRRRLRRSDRPVSKRHGNSRHRPTRLRIDLTAIVEA